MANPFTSGMAAPTQIPNDYSVANESLMRQRLLADQLRKQALQTDPGTQVVSGWAVPNSPLGGINKVAEALLGGYMQKDADKKQTDLSNKANEALISGLTNYKNTLQGTPASSVPSMAMQPNEDGTPQQISTPAVPGDKQAALEGLLRSGDPRLQQFGLQQMLAKPENMFSKIDPKDYTADSIKKFAATNDFASLVPVRKMEISSGGQAYNPYQLQAGQVLTDPNKPFSIGPDGQPVANAGYQNYEMAKAKRGATNVNNTVSVAGPENQYNKDIGAGLAKEGLSTIQAAQQAPETIRNARAVIQALDNGAITGTGADTRLALQKALETAGVVGEGKAANTQQLMAGLGKMTLAGIKSSGLGAGQGFTDNDRKFLEGSISGTIDSTPANLRRVADLSEKMARQNYTQGAKILQRWQTDPALKNIVQDYSIGNIPQDTPVTNNAGWGIRKLP